MKEQILEIFRYQALNCEPYAKYVNLLSIDIQRVTEIEEIPFLPIEFFRSHKVYCARSEPQAVFHSSGTTGADTSSHYIASLELYEQSFLAAFNEFYGSPSVYNMRTMLPSYRPGSSLLYMVSKLQPLCTGSRVLLLGVSFALLEAVRSGDIQKLPAGSIVMETGGMKGHNYEISRAELHAELCDGFGVDKIHSEYGMCELLSQAYSSGDGIFRPSSAMQVYIRDASNPLKLLPDENIGGLNIIDLSNRYSCSFIATGDKAIKHTDGTFEVLGRLGGEILRGCNMLDNN